MVRSYQYKASKGKTFVRWLSGHNDGKRLLVETSECKTLVRLLVGLTHGKRLSVESLIK